MAYELSEIKSGSALYRNPEFSGVIRFILEVLGKCYFDYEIGIGLLVCGILFTLLGVVLFFDKGLLALGNIFFLSGVALLLGWKSTSQLFTSKLKGSIPFFFGLILIFVRLPIVGIIMEVYGSVVLFSGFWQSVKGFLYQIPVIGWLVQLLG